ncbi:sulfite exporter TauE/SafE family protein [Roseomonas sp. NAR14]|uniref:Probable membrane transporter protein n=1 Tax=Roseomonas acroporae TaxID=2937791 RepID=A0A9X2BXJ8_9PROT|nr:sulfite exporter TauE/SafE family protein [Roseomonas acroporae]
MTAYLFVLAVGLAAGALSGVIGTGSSLLLLPVLNWQFGPQQAVPIMAIAAVLANLAKTLSWWREVDWRAAAAYAAAGVPGAMLGARTLLVLPPRAVELALGLFFIAMIPTRRLLRVSGRRIGAWQLALAGGAIGFVTGLVIATGPLSVPAFLAYGLTRGAFLGTEAAASLALMIGKVATFREFGALPEPVIVQGLLVGGAVMAGSFSARLAVLRMSHGLFDRVLDGLLLGAGIAVLLPAFL